MKTPEDEVTFVDHCELVSTPAPWAIADSHQLEIEANWQRRVQQNPTFFNGTVHLVSRYSIEGSTLRAELTPVPFKSFLYWKDQGYPDRSVFDVFGSALIRSLEGHVLLGRQSAGNLNAGLAYLPGGFIDKRDVAHDGKIDIAASIRRELLEEAGLSLSDLEERAGFFLTRCGQLLSIAVEYRSPLPAEALAAKIRGYIAREREAELASIEIISSLRDLDQIAVAHYVRVLLGAIFDEK